MYRTPLILSIEENHLEITHILLSNGAYPWSTALSDLKTCLEQNEKAKNLLTKVRRVYKYSNFSYKLWPNGHNPKITLVFFDFNFLLILIKQKYWNQL